VKPENTEVLLKPSQVAALFNVDPKTVSSWGDAGKLTVIKTLGGHRRFRASEVMALRDGIARAAGLDGVVDPAREREREAG
jgi:excisionase family DNA binding protein